MKTRIHSRGILRRPAGASISHRETFLAVLEARLRRATEAVMGAAGIGSRRRSRLRLVRRNGRPVPVPLRAVVKTRNLRMGRIAVAILLSVSLLAAGVYGTIYLGPRAPSVFLTAMK